MPAPARRGSPGPGRARPSSPQRRVRSARTSPRRARIPPRRQSRRRGGPSSLPFGAATPSSRTESARRYLSLRPLETVEDHVNPPNLLPVEVEGVRNRKGVRQPVGNLPGAGLDAPTDVRFRPRVQERVDDVAPRERGIEERTVRMPTLG